MKTAARKTVTALWLAAFLAAGCAAAPAAKPPTPTPAASSCGLPGTVQAAELNIIGQIGVYLPPCYDPSPARSYPVLYLLPGFGGDYHEWLVAGVATLADRSISERVIPPFIIVTTDDTYEGVDQNQIIPVLLPYAESHFHASPEREYRAIAGGSLGGATAYVLTFQHPDVFSSAGVFGNGLTTGQEAELEGWLKSIPPRLKPRVFINSGEQDTFMLAQAKALIPFLDKYGIEHSEIFSSGGHDDNYWLSNFPAYFHWLAEGWD
ncbi:MAG TPA: alpha/beta hydrolase-fold protein [Anaerolineales bacterium]|nr:alpha/beta hydrolase-fold protein [Anaerolineales bacterium]